MNETVPCIQCGKPLEKFGDNICSDCRDNNKEFKICRGSEILWAFNKEDIADIKEIRGGLRIEGYDGSGFEIDKTVEEMKNILGVVETK